MQILGVADLILLLAVLVVSVTGRAGTIVGHVTVVPAIQQTESMEHPAFQKEAYVPVIPKGENVALGKKVKSNGFNDVYTPRKVVDGNTGGVSYWEGKSDAYPNTLTVDLGKVTEIHTLRLCLNPLSLWGKRTQTCSVEVSEDGSTYTERVPSADYDFDPDTGNQVTIPMEGTKARYVQVSFTSNTGSGGGQLAELELYH